MRKVLIIEDDSSIAELQKDYLELAGFEVEICTDGTEGQHRLLHKEFDLLILDIMLPGKDGLEILRSLKEGKEIPVLLVSARKEEIDKIKGFSLGADDYITKPFSPGELVARVKAHLENYERLRERFCQQVMRQERTLYSRFAN
jgi:DNA-binding response OmpR family regulator